MKWCAWRGAALFVLAVLCGGCSGDMFRPIVLFSEVRGRVVDGDRPVVGATLVQKMIWSDDDSENVVRRVQTGADGAFHFDAIVRKAGWHRISLSQPSMIESIVIEHGGKQYAAWTAAKMTYEPNSELGGRPIRLDCNLSRPVEVRDGYYGICVAR